MDALRVAVGETGGLGHAVTCHTFVPHLRIESSLSVSGSGAIL